MEVSRWLSGRLEASEPEAAGGKGAGKATKEATATIALSYCRDAMRSAHSVEQTGSDGSLYLVHRAFAASRIDAGKLDVGQMPYRV